ncbi:MAG TPA: lysine-sensitive aspartokinase 3 [Spirochaetia bacterium]|nr:lysine-sensitive aspartokinase 3 [Spirochaetia bacterium]
MKVIKFGGTSVGSAEMIDRTLDIAESMLNDAPLLVASAMSKTTDALVLITSTASSGDEAKSVEILDGIKQNHLSTAKALLQGDLLDQTLQRLDAYFSEISSLIKGLSLLRECTPRSSDAILSFGELLSTTLIAARARGRGIDAELFDSRDFVRTDDAFTAASPLMEETAKLTREVVHPRPGKLCIAQGFIGRTQSGVTSTLGRGGSDFSATIIGSALEADEVIIWTDVNGIMTSDPRVVPEAKTISTISYNEAAELAYFGAKVVHPSTIQPAVEKGIPVWVKNTRDPNGKGTRIVAAAEGTGLRALAGKRDITLIHVSSTRMLNAYGFLSRIFSIFETNKTPVDLIATSEVSVSMSIDNTRSLKTIITELEEIGTVDVEGDLSIICLVGQDLWKDSSFIARVFGALKDIPIRMISLGSSDINLSLVVPVKMMDTAIRELHGEFFD